MPINDNPDTKVKLICHECKLGFSDVEDIEDATVCSNCQGAEFTEMTVKEWMEKETADEKSDETGLFTFEDMMKAYRLGVCAESGNFPYRDYMGTKKIIEKYFKPLQPGEVLVK